MSIRYGKSNPEVTIIVPTKDCEETISLLLNSLAHLKGNYEVIVVDSSRDKTPEIVKKYPFVRLVRLGRKGLNAARNLGIKLARGEIIAFTDGDCIVPENWVLEIVNAIKGKGFAAVGGSVLLAYPLKDDLIAKYSEISIIPIFVRYEREKVIDKNNFFRKFAVLRPPSGNNMAFRRDILLSVGLFDEHYTTGYDEIDLEWRICAKGYEILCTPKIRVYHMHRSKLIKLLRQIYGYGKGHYIFLIKHKSPQFLKLTVLMLIAWCIGMFLLLLLPLLSIFHILPKYCLLTSILLYLAYTSLYMRRTKILRALMYPMLDILSYGAYIMGFITEMSKRGLRLK